VQLSVVSAVVRSHLTVHWLQSDHFPLREHSSNDIHQIRMPFVICCHGNNACPCYISHTYIHKDIENNLFAFLYATLT
jgi:hypothetical protein